MRRLKNLPRDERGATLVEFTLILPLLLVLTFGLVEFGYALWQWNSAEKATAAGARYIATRGPLVSGVDDCFVNTSDPAGTSCSQVAGAKDWCCVYCPGGSCDTTVMADLVARMQQFAPFIAAENVRVDVAGSGMGFVGRGAPVPLITVRLANMTFDFIALDDLLGLGPINMPGFAATSVGEDLNEGMGAST